MKTFLMIFYFSSSSYSIHMIKFQYKRKIKRLEKKSKIFTIRKVKGILFELVVIGRSETAGVLRCRGANWEHDPYKAVTRSTLEYCTPIWSPIISDTNWSRLQSVQNQGLRVTTGCLLMTSQEHFHQECKMMPVRIITWKTNYWIYQSHSGNSSQPTLYYRKRLRINYKAWRSWAWSLHSTSQQ